MSVFRLTSFLLEVVTQIPCNLRDMSNKEVKSCAGKALPRFAQRDTIQTDFASTGRKWEREEDR